MRYYADERADAIAEEIAKMICSDADIGVVLGSGWGGVADFLSRPKSNRVLSFAHSGGSLCSF